MAGTQWWELGAAEGDVFHLSLLSWHELGTSTTCTINCVLPAGS